MKNLIAQVEIPIGEPLSGLGPLGNPGANAPTLFNNFLSAIIGIMTAIAAIWFTFLLITGAIGIISSGGEKGAYEDARKRITTGLVGIIVVVAGIFLIDLVGNLIGLPDILNPGAFVQQLTF